MSVSRSLAQIVDMKRIILAMTLVLTLTGCTKKTGESAPASAPKANHAETVSPEKEKAVVEVETSLGTIVLELDAKKAPKSVANFLSYVSDGFYNGTIFHRVIDGFMIQGGGFDAKMVQKPTKAPVVNEASNGLSNGPYTIAMARTNDPNSATAQFFINLVDNKRLDASGGNAGYAVFGKVIEGKEVVDKIGKVATGSSGMFDDVPTTTVTIKSVKQRS